MDRTRRDKVREILISKPFTALSELEEKFPEVSSMTLRRDIEYFEEKGDVIKVRGGARAMHFITLTLEDNYYKRSLEASHNKERIAAAAVRYMETGRSIYFDSGTTVMQMVPKLPDEKLTISTSDPNIALALVKKEHAVVNVIGGSLNRSNLSLSGQMALQFVESTNIDVAFLSPSGFSLECGFTSGNYNESLLKKAIVEKARLVVMLLTSSKIRKAMPHTFASLSDVHVFITDADPGEEIRKACEEAGVRLIVAQS
ncbi:MAG: DeoR/GlpR transcriptional regulator [Lachnospiraceae bacterium]|nr:DeoR/GlpR transcriptional regulator [Lachnospiraceae bacterium]